MVNDETYVRDTPWLAIVASIWIAGFASSALAAAIQPQLAFHSWGAYSAYRLLLSATVGAVVLRAVLPRLAGLKIGYGAAVCALAAGGAVGMAVQLVWLHAARHVTAAGPAAMPIFAAGSIVSLAASLVGVVVTYQIVVTLARQAGGASAAAVVEMPTVDLPPVEARRHDGTRDWLDVAVADARAAVVSACTEIGSATAIAVPGRILDALADLGVCTRALRAGEVADAPLRAAVAELVEGLERFQAALTELGSPPLEGARLRYELEHADGLAGIRAALERIESLRSDSDD